MSYLLKSGVRCCKNSAQIVESISSAHKPQQCGCLSNKHLKHPLLPYHVSNISIQQLYQQRCHVSVISLKPLPPTITVYYVRNFVYKTEKNNHLTYQQYHCNAQVNDKQTVYKCTES